MRAGEVEEMSEQQVIKQEGKEKEEQVEKQANAVTDLSLNWKEEEPRFYTHEEEEALKEMKVERYL